MQQRSISSTNSKIGIKTKYGVLTYGDTVFLGPSWVFIIHYSSITINSITAAPFLLLTFGLGRFFGVSIYV